MFEPTYGERSQLCFDGTNGMPLNIKP